MAHARRALLLAFLGVCALLLAVGVVAPQESPRDRGAAGATVAAPAGEPGAAPDLSPSVAKQWTPLVLIATSETAAAVRRGRHRARPVGRRAGGQRRGRRPAPGPGRGHAGPHRRLRPDRVAQVDEQLARMAIELNVLVGSFRY